MSDAFSKATIVKEGPPDAFGQQFSSKKLSDDKDVAELGPLDRPNVYLETLLQGLTFNTSDEVQAAMKATSDLISARLSGEKETPFSSFYSRNLRAFQQSERKFRQEHPVMAFSGELVGGLLSGLGVVKQATKGGTSLVGKVVRGTVSGAATGAVSGAASTEEGLGNRLTGGVVGATVGAPLGGAIPLIGAGGKVAVDRGRGLANKARLAINQTRKAPKNIPKFSKAEIKGRVAILEALDNDNLTIDKAIDSIRSKGDDAVLADLGENTRRLGREFISKPSRQRTLLVEELTDRRLSRGDRIISQVNKALGTGDDVFGVFDEITKRLSDEAGENYTKAFTAKASITQKNLFLEQLNTHSGIRAIKHAQKIASNKRLDLPFSVKGGKIVFDETKDLTVQHLHLLKLGFSQEVSSHRHPITNKMDTLGQSVVQVKNEFVKLIDDVSHEYKEARMKFSDDISNLEAFQAGRKIFSEDFEITLKAIKEMPESEKDFFLIGVSRAMRDKVLSSPDDADVFRRIFTNKSTKNMLEAVFPDKKSFSQFAKMIKDESDFFKTERIALRSPTARVADQAGVGLISPKTPFIKHLNDFFEEFSDKTEDEMAALFVERMFTRNALKNELFLRELSEASREISPFWRRVITKGISRATIVPTSSLASEFVTEEPLVIEIRPVDSTKGE